MRVDIDLEETILYWYGIEAAKLKISRRKLLKEVIIKYKIENSNENP